VFLKASFHSFPQGNLVIIFLLDEVGMVQFLQGLVNGMKKERPGHFTIFSLEEKAPISPVIQDDSKDENEFHLSLAIVTRLLLLQGYFSPLRVVIVSSSLTTST